MHEIDNENEFTIRISGSETSWMFYISFIIVAGVLIFFLIWGVVWNSLVNVLSGIVICMPLIALLYGMLKKTQYIITTKALIIRTIASQDERILLVDIDSLTLVTNTLSAKALSPQRIDVQYGKFHSYISPKDRDLFMSELNDAISVARGCKVGPATTEY